MALCHIDDKVDKSDIIMQDQVANIIMAFFPGIVSGLQEIAMGSEVQNHKITMVIYDDRFLYTLKYFEDIPKERLFE